MPLLCLALATTAWAAPKKNKPAAAEAPANDENGVDKARCEAYLKDRLQKIQQAHKMRMDFFDQERSHWEAFWTRIRDERRKFEIRVTRQSLDLFESLSSLDARDQPSTISNIEKLRGDLIKSFEASQKQRIQDFFSTHEKHWNDFAAQQEKERAEFMADAEVS